MHGIPIPANAEEVLLQMLMLKVRNRSVKLGTKVRLDGTEPCELNWNMPKRTLYTKTGEVTIEPSARYVEILEDDEVPVLIWVAWKLTEQEVVMHLNTNLPVEFRLGELKEPFVDMDIQFIPIDKKSRRFRLNLKSWDEFNLVERN
jgi:hypothetical protein